MCCSWLRSNKLFKGSSYVHKCSLANFSFSIYFDQFYHFTFCSVQPPAPTLTLTLTLRAPLLLLFCSAFTAPLPPRVAASPRSSKRLSSSPLILLLKRLWRVRTARVHRTYMTPSHRCSSRWVGGFISRREPCGSSTWALFGSFSLTAVVTLFNPLISSVPFLPQLFHLCPESRSLPANATLPKNW